MRILATAIVIAIAAASVGCSGSSPSPSRAAAQPVTQTTAAPSNSAAGPTKATSGSRRAVKTLPAHLPAHLVGRPLDVAERMLHRAGISYKLIPLHGHINGVATRWGVCETVPVANSTESSPVVDLVVARLRCGGH